MLLGSIIALTLICGFIYFIHHKAERRHSYSGHHHKHAAENRSRFHCVEAHHPPQCCNAVKDIEGKRFLSAEAPILPVKGCDNPHCHCDYVHHDDRRSENRRTDLGIQHDMYGQNGEQEHRDESHHGRRKTD